MTDSSIPASQNRIPGDATSKSPFVVLVPSITKGRIISATDWLEAFAERATVIIVANSRSVAATHIHGAETYDIGTNLGFGPAINRAVARAAPPDWQWAIILNDDLQFESGEADRIIDLLESATDADLVFLDRGKPQDIPGPFGVFISLSLIDKVYGAAIRWFRRQPDDRTAGALHLSGGGDCPVASNTFFGFSAVAISKETWSRVGGFRETIPFYFEDADFMRRYWAGGHHRAVHRPRQLIHHRSVSSASHLDVVLPAAAASAVEYLSAYTGRRTRAQIVVMVALVVRFAFVLGARASVTRHVRGVARSMIAVWRPQTVMLPPYYDL